MCKYHDQNNTNVFCHEKATKRMRKKACIESKLWEYFALRMLFLFLKALHQYYFYEQRMIFLPTNNQSRLIFHLPCRFIVRNLIAFVILFRLWLCWL